MPGDLRLRLRAVFVLWSTPRVQLAPKLIGNMLFSKPFSRALVSSFILYIPTVTKAYTTLSDASLKSLPDPSVDFNIHNGKLLAPILIPRVPGTPNSLKVLQHFADFWSNELPDWKVEYDNSTATTPISNGKEIPFVSVMTTDSSFGAQIDAYNPFCLAQFPRN